MEAGLLEGPPPPAMTWYKGPGMEGADRRRVNARGPGAQETSSCAHASKPPLATALAPAATAICLGVLHELELLCSAFAHRRNPLQQPRLHQQLGLREADFRPLLELRCLRAGR